MIPYGQVRKGLRVDFLNFTRLNIIFSFLAPGSLLYWECRNWPKTQFVLLWTSEDASGYGCVRCPSLLLVSVDWGAKRPGYNRGRPHWVLVGLQDRRGPLSGRLPVVDGETDWTPVWGVRRSPVRPWDPLPSTYALTGLLTLARPGKVTHRRWQITVG